MTIVYVDIRLKLGPIVAIWIGFWGVDNFGGGG